MLNGRTEGEDIKSRPAPAGKPVTLAPLTPEEAMRGLLAVKPITKVEKPKKSVKPAK